jgi:NAD-dependent deacetylase
MELATPKAFAEEPEKVWAFYNWRRQVIASVSPNPAHLALVRLENRVDDFVLITQNVDGLHRQAGSRNLLEIHGNLWRLRCIGCNTAFSDRRLDLGPRPQCNECGELLRPDVVWFGEMLDQIVLGQSLEACSRCQVMLVIGTSALVQPAASFSLHAKEQGAKIFEINLEQTSYSRLMDFVLLGKAGDIVPRLVDEGG